MEKWENAGYISVDAGLCWIGDPCYIVGDDASSKFNTWEEFLEKITDIDKEGHVELPHQNSQIPGLGVACTTGGDGCYPVYVQKRNGRVVAVKVVFED